MGSLVDFLVTFLQSIFVIAYNLAVFLPAPSQPLIPVLHARGRVHCLATSSSANILTKHIIPVTDAHRAIYRGTSASVSAVKTSDDRNSTPHFLSHIMIIACCASTSLAPR